MNPFLSNISQLPSVKSSSIKPTRFRFLGWSTCFILLFALPYFAIAQAETSMEESEEPAVKVEDTSDEPENTDVAESKTDTTMEHVVEDTDSHPVDLENSTQNTAPSEPNRLFQTGFFLSYQLVSGRKFNHDVFKDDPKTKLCQSVGLHGELLFIHKELHRGTKDPLILRIGMLIDLAPHFNLDKDNERVSAPFFNKDDVQFGTVEYLGSLFGGFGIAAYLENLVPTVNRAQQKILSFRVGAAIQAGFDLSSLAFTTEYKESMASPELLQITTDQQMSLGFQMAVRGSFDMKIEKLKLPLIVGTIISFVYWYNDILIPSAFFSAGLRAGFAY